MPSVLHGQTKNIRHGWSRGKIQTKIWDVIDIICRVFDKKRQHGCLFSFLRLFKELNAKLLFINV